MSAQAPSTILIRTPNWIGDQILAYPFFHFLRRAYPRAKIVAACVPWVEDVQFRNLVDDVVVLPKALHSGFFGKWETLETAAAKIRKAGSFDLGIVLPNSFSAAWLFFRAGVDRRIGFSADARGWLLSERRDWLSNESVHRSQAYVNLLPEGEIPKLHVRDFWGIPPETDLDPGTPGVIEKFDFEKAWPNPNRIPAPKDPYWVLAPGSTADSRRWGETPVSVLAGKIHEKIRIPGLIIGGPAEAPVARRLRDQAGPALQDWTARGSVTSYADVFRNARFTVSNDSGLAHVASLCGSPTYIVWGAGNPKRTQPLGPGKVKIVFNPIDCWPCERNSCLRPSGRKLECLEGISVESVFQEMETHVGR